MIKRQEYSIEDIKKVVKEKNIKTVYLYYIWMNECEKCKEYYPTLDEEYSITISTEQEYLTPEKVEENIKYFEKEYFDINRETKDYTFISKNETELYFYRYRYDNDIMHYCPICDEVF